MTVYFYSKDANEPTPTVFVNVENGWVTYVGRAEATVNSQPWSL